MTAIWEASVGERRGSVDGLRFGVVNGDQLLEVLAEAVDAVAGSLSGLADWGLPEPGPDSTGPTSWRMPPRSVFSPPPARVLSEESGLSEGASELALLAVLDPVDGSTNASRRIPWFATSICVLDDDGPLAAMVVNQATGTRYEAVRRGGARRDVRRSRHRAKSRSADL